MLNDNGRYELLSKFIQSMQDDVSTTPGERVRPAGTSRADHEACGRELGRKHVVKTSCRAWTRPRMRRRCCCVDVQKLALDEERHVHAKVEFAGAVFASDGSCD